MHRKHHWLARQLDYWQKVLHWIEAQFVDVRVARYLVTRNKKRITVRRTLGRCLHSDVARSARSILDKKLALEDSRQGFCDNASAYVTRAPSGKWNNNAHRPERIGLRLRETRSERQRNSADGQM
jgi:hypothetical protein